MLHFRVMLLLSKDYRRTYVLTWKRALLWLLLRGRANVLLPILFFSLNAAKRPWV
jgi:hypothetical protein